MHSCMIGPFSASAAVLHCPSGRQHDGILRTLPKSTISMSLAKVNTPYIMLKGLKDLARSMKFKTWLLDQFGVLHDGQRPYPGVIETLNGLVNVGAKLVVLSNSSKCTELTIQRLANLGFDPSLFSGVITSGELTYQHLFRRQDPWFAKLGHRCIHMTWSERGSISLEGLGLEVVEEPEIADFVLAHGTEGLEKVDGSIQCTELGDLEAVLMSTVKRGLPLIVANPDYVTVEARALTVMPGTLGRKYEQLGGHVKYMGKPDPVIYQAAEELTGEKAAEMIAVGDSLLHDICGAAIYGIHSVFIAGGIHADELGIDHIGDQLKVEALESLFHQQSIYPSYVIPMFHW
eukprot:c25511_g1_i1 orf=87-1124(+)